MGLILDSSGVRPLTTMDGCPSHQRTWADNDFFKCFRSTYHQHPRLQHQPFCRVVGAMERAAPHLFRPMYAGANMGHPSRGSFNRTSSSQHLPRSASLRDPPLRNRRCRAKAVDCTLLQTAIQPIYFSLHNRTHLSRLAHRPQVEQ
jgi:hypothetical protein